MNTDTITAAIQIARALDTDTSTNPSPDHPDDLLEALIGCDVLIRTVTMIYTGHVVALDAHTIVLTNAAWIADTGRFTTALETGDLSEVEPYPEAVYVSRACVVDVTTWQHALPRTQK